jgi:hypothetical protein
VGAEGVWEPAVSAVIGCCSYPGTLPVVGIED